MATIDPTTWNDARQQVHAALRSGLHCAIGSINADGTPHITPIGSVFLSTEPGDGLYFDAFNAQLGRNLDINPNLCLLAVDPHKRVWLRALVTGRFARPPGVRLKGTAGPARAATNDEIERFRRRIKPVAKTRGARHIDEHIDGVRDLAFTSARTIRIGSMTLRSTAQRATSASGGRAKDPVDRYELSRDTGREATVSE